MAQSEPKKNAVANAAAYYYCLEITAMGESAHSKALDALF
jgi:hypothetical protein